MKEKACETSIGVYNHNSPAYQVSRGDCICYTGDIVCQRPKEGEGVFRAEVTWSSPMVGFLRITLTYISRALQSRSGLGGITNSVLLFRDAVGLPPIIAV